MNTQTNRSESSAGRDLNLTFCRSLLSLVMADVRKVTTVAERKDAWVYDFGNNHWEFHGPEGYYWHGSADNAYDAKAKGWQHWWASLEADAAKMKARTLGQKLRAKVAR